MTSKPLIFNLPTKADAARAADLIATTVEAAGYVNNAITTPGPFGRLTFITFEIRYSCTALGEGFCSLAIPDGKADAYLDAVDEIVASGEDYDNGIQYLIKDGAAFASGPSPAASLLALENKLKERN